MKNYEELTLNGDAFADLRNDFDSMIQKLLLMMQTNKSEEGAISIKANISTVPACVDLGDGNVKEVFKPIITHKIEYTVPVKESKSGAHDTGMQLVFDKDLQQFVLQYMQDSQCSFYDEEYSGSAAPNYESTADSPGITSGMISARSSGGSTVYDL